MGKSLQTYRRVSPTSMCALMISVMFIFYSPFQNETQQLKTKLIDN